MDRLNVWGLEPVYNVCDQVLREVEVVQTPQLDWSMAHVTMNPKRDSRLHRHRRMKEVYVITKGFGELVLGTHTHADEDNKVVAVAAGSVIEIPVGMPHKLRNMSAGYLEHFVFAFPAFDPTDVELLKEVSLVEEAYRVSLPPVQDCFDGAKILPYALTDLDASFAFGWVINDPTRRKKPHYHKETIEFVYVVEGSGYLELGPESHLIQSGDWIRIPPDTEHALRNYRPEDMVVVCTCFPAFRMEDVYYRS